MDRKLLGMLLDLLVLAEGDAIRLGDRAYAEAARIAVEGVRRTECGGVEIGREHLIRATETYARARNQRIPRARIEAEIDAELNRAIIRRAA
jgi:hypothetical protein